MKKILRFNHRYQRIIPRLLAIIVLVGLQPWLWGLVLARATSLQAQRSQQAQLVTLRSRIEQIKKNAVTQEDFLDQVSAAVPARAALPQVIERLERLSADQQTQLEILDISDVPRVNDDVAAIPIRTVRVAIQVKGSAVQVLSVIDSIEHIQEVAMIERWSLNPAPVQLVPSPVPGEYLYFLTANVLFFLNE